MESIAYYDGKIGAPEELMVPFNDRVHFFGDGCYDATVGANGKVYLLQDHLDRFFTSAKALDINIPMSKTELGRLLTDLLAKVDSKVNFVYWQVTRGVEPRNHVYEEGVPGKLWVSIRPNTLNDPDKPIRLNSEEDTRFYHCNIKTLNLLPSVMTAQRAKLAGMSETVFHRELLPGDVAVRPDQGVVHVEKPALRKRRPLRFQLLHPSISCISPVNRRSSSSARPGSELSTLSRRIGSVFEERSSTRPSGRSNRSPSKVRG